jgi:hypothetical protein
MSLLTIKTKTRNAESVTYLERAHPSPSYDQKREKNENDVSKTQDMAPKMAEILRLSHPLLPFF